MMKNLTLTIIALLICIGAKAQLPAPITGPTSLCDGTTITLADATPAGTWTSSALTVATVSASTGIVTGVSAGVTTITYSISTGFVTYPVTVYALPPAITGTPVFCIGSTTTLYDAMSGGLWSSSNPAVANVGSSSGIVSGTTTGIATISYTAPTGCFTTRPVSANSTPGAITGPSTVCTGGTITLTGTGGGTWSSGTTGVATVGTGTGIVTGISPGTTIISYSLPVTLCSSSMLVTVTSGSTTAFTVTGGGTYCAGGSGVPVGLSGSVVGVNYQLFHGGVPLGSPMAGTGSTISFGMMTAAGVYAVVATTGGGCSMGMTGSVTVTIGALPIAYTVTTSGGGSYCAGGSGLHILLSGSDVGVNYQLYLGTTAVGSPMPGTGSSLDFGLHTSGGSYTVVAVNAVTGCMNTMAGSGVISISPLPSVHAMTGGGSYCAGGAGVVIGLVGSSAGVNYQLYNGSSAVGSPIAGTGAPISFGMMTTAGTYTVIATDAATTCSNTMAGTAVVSITALPTVTASSSSACGGVVTLSGGGAITYSWAPSTGLSCTACGTATTTPASTIVYTVTGTDGSGCVNTATVSVNGNIISGQITYTGGVSTDVFKVWLVQYDPTDSSILATDSTTTCMISGTTPYYEFAGAAAGSYMVKAKLNGTVAGTSGYIPTYGTSTPNWYSAASITHASSANTMNITMVYGTVPSGPGFISGYVYAGAGKGTAGDYPEPDMLVYLKDAAGNVLTYTYTDAAGAYTFSGLGYGSYVIYPEEYDYYTVPSALLTLSSSVTSMSGLYFKKGTTSHTIKPLPMFVNGPAATKEFNIYPNPTSGELSIEWTAQTTGNVEIALSDVTGRNVYNTTVDVTPATGKTMLNLQELKAGIYLINVKSNDLNYNGKVMIQK